MVTVDAMVGVAGMIAMVIELMIAAASRYFFSSCLIPKMSEIVQYNTMQYILFLFHSNYIQYSIIFYYGVS